VRIKTQLPVSDRAPARARAAIADVLLDALPAERVQDGQLLVSELVTNSVLHAGLTSTDSISLVVTIDDLHVRIAVSDRGGGFEHRPDPEAGERPFGLWETGRGLSLVELLADRWGTGAGDGSEVWFEIDR
jgi:anti-sigma regulatory factor (Ser/Thr protein kinase)